MIDYGIYNGMTLLHLSKTWKPNSLWNAVVKSHTHLNLKEICTKIIYQFNTFKTKEKLSSLLKVNGPISQNGVFYLK